MNIRILYFIICVIVARGMFFSNIYSQENSRLREKITSAANDTTDFPTPPKGYDATRSDIAHGKMNTFTYYSKTVGANRQAMIYTPPDYSEDKKYNVLYLLHGIGGDEREWFYSGKPQNILDNLNADQKLSPMLVVFPNGRAMKNDDPGSDIYAPDKIKAFETFEFDLINDLIPFIDANYPVLKGKENRALAGLSMGGGQSLNFGLSHPDTIAYVGAFSAAPNTKAPALLAPDPSATAKNFSKIWISCGTADGLLYISKQTHDYFVQHNIPHIYSLVLNSGHDWSVWKPGLYYFSQLIFKETATSVDNNEMITTYSLEQNYPNPFNPVTNINYQLEKDGYATLKIYNMLGREVAVLVNEYKPKGKHSVKFDASKLASGVYFYKLQAGSFSDMKKLVLMK